MFYNAEVEENNLCAITNSTAWFGESMLFFSFPTHCKQPITWIQFSKVKYYADFLKIFEKVFFISCCVLHCNVSKLNPFSFFAEEFAINLELINNFEQYLS